ncbi:hypothetical protein FQN50_001563 [Emmonsiellopsis sp. PD_5]|nr:hypothetical protein FQN50_001563 [Emmonsiellopsis sp. PD_5]
MPERTLTHEDYTVGWVCALPFEMAAVIAMLDETHGNLPNRPGDENIYTLGSVGGHDVVIASLRPGAYGNAGTARVIPQMLSSFKSIRFGLMVGIGSGVPSRENDIRLGDIVVSSATVQYDRDKLPSQTVSHKPPQTLSAAVSKLEARHTKEGSQIPHFISKMVSDYPRMSREFVYQGQDRLFEAGYTHVNPGESCESCDITKLVHRLPRATNTPVVHHGIVACSPLRMKDGCTRDRVAKDLGAICFDEGAVGLLYQFPCLVIRGIWDCADTHFDRRWMRYAAAAAAAYAKELLYVVEPQETSTIPNATEISTMVEAMINSQRVSKVVHWLTPANSPAQQREIIAKRQEGTGLWLLESREYKMWKAQGTTLFCPGIPGAGKTMMAAIVVDELQQSLRDRDETGIACLFCTYRKQTEQTAADLLAGLLKQLVQQRQVVPKALEDLHQTHSRRGTRPSLEELSEALFSVIIEYSKVFIIIDALDECSNINKDRDYLVEKLFELQRRADLSFFATSRFVPDIERIFHGRGTRMDIRAHDEDVQKYLKGHMSLFPSFVSRNSALQEDIQAMSITSLDGMFPAQPYLNSLIHKRTAGAIRRTLLEESELSDQVCEESMAKIKDQKAGFPHIAERVMSWIVCARRPITTLELREALAVEVGDRALDDDNFEDIGEAISACAGLVMVEQKTNLIRYAHYTIEQYFRRTQPRWFPDAHAEITVTCITYLSFDQFSAGYCCKDDQFEARLKSNVLYDYAARYWGHHAHQAPELADNLMLNFLQNEDKVTSACQAMLVLPNDSREPGYSQAAPREVTGLHLAAHFGLDQAATVLLKTGLDPTARDTNGQTPLWWAAKEGHDLVIKLFSSTDTVTLPTLAAEGHQELIKSLLERGYDVNTKDFRKRTPLHNAISCGDLELAAALISSGADTNSEDNYGTTPLQLAFWRTNLNFIDLLLKYGANTKGIVAAEWYRAYGKEESHASDLSELRQEVLSAKGENPNLLEAFLRDAQKWAEFRTYLRDQINGARKFSREYSRRYNEGRALDYLLTEIDDFSEEISTKISQLDELSNDLIRVVSMPVIYYIPG